MRHKERIMLTEWEDLEKKVTVCVTLLKPPHKSFWNGLQFTLGINNNLTLWKYLPPWPAAVQGGWTGEMSKEPLRSALTPTLIRTLSNLHRKVPKFYFKSRKDCIMVNIESLSLHTTRLIFQPAWNNTGQVWPQPVNKLSHQTKLLSLTSALCNRRFCALLDFSVRAVFLLREINTNRCKVLIFRLLAGSPQPSGCQVSGQV